MAARARWRLLLLPLSLFLAVGPAGALAAPSPPVSKAISDLRDAIVKGLGFQAEGLKVSGFDVRDALVGQAVAYEFDIEVGRKVLPVRLLEDVTRWDFVDLPIFRSQADADDTALAEIRRGGRGSVVEPTLPPFQLAGPMELWIQDGDDVRLALPHDVDAGTLKKVVLSDGAVVTVKGARAVSLRLPLELPLPLNRTTYKGRLSSLLSIAQALRGAARSNKKPLLSLRIEGPTSLSSTPSMSPNDKLKLKRLAPGQVELSSRAIPAVTDDEHEPHNTGLWPLLSLNGSDGSLQGFEELLASVLGKKAGEKGTFKLLKGRASAQTYVKMAFTVEKRLTEGEVNWSDFPEWKTKPKKLRAHYEVLARVEGGQAIPERIAQVQPFQAEEATSESVLTGNVTRSKMEMVHPPPVYFTL
ncbi:protein TUNICAMYCIN INDUCED 1-like [Phragmites australis]|uniref:protein TUNICAMYCIN INDUCED 1-like n=1 Tax=Phragmites australis TaxID=29695 RepID=UPI002D768A2D|nr:protein TUNICAMYCIN INDUCED 1-like [Phragmites australis]